MHNQIFKSEQDARQYKFLNSINRIIHFAFKNRFLLGVIPCNEGDRQTDRFEFKQGGKPSMLATLRPHWSRSRYPMEPRLGRSKPRNRPEIVCIIINDLLAQMFNGPRIRIACSLMEFPYDTQRGEVTHRVTGWMPCSIDIAVGTLLGT
ncbi:MAG: hypothetical protein CM1200mP39_01700 [Dehalococcoidia bacterium]|nr:MAG: hypothetical protein CM1200mP39_01700 [Dehalococcoidia bacterium]